MRPFIGVVEAALAKLPFHAGPVNRGLVAAEGRFSTCEIALPGATTTDNAGRVSLSSPVQLAVLDRYLIATGLITACTAPSNRGWPSTNRNSQPSSAASARTCMFSRM